MPVRTDGFFLLRFRLASGLSGCAGLSIAKTGDQPGTKAVTATRVLT